MLAFFKIYSRLIGDILSVGDDLSIHYEASQDWLLNFKEILTGVEGVGVLLEILTGVESVCVFCLISRLAKNYVVLIKTNTPLGWVYLPTQFFSLTLTLIIKYNLYDT